MAASIAGDFVQRRRTLGPVNDPPQPQVNGQAPDLSGKTAPRWHHTAVNRLRAGTQGHLRKAALVGWMICGAVTASEQQTVVRVVEGVISDVHSSERMMNKRGPGAVELPTCR
ncbi:hypothetical protein B0A48_14250 [Cryoendolithus antarcticus]|uniref:Uncharacterized protein n=1 Tax=Cryoendolithus antarcticus TaxID=1507870 RepID=A0A1V8SLK4_9PEZI|nr:hypothetical protein B0A48_14250 [Cryoendolithus antarcticus]